MGINQLQLSPELIALLYPESLVETRIPDSAGEKDSSSLPFEETVYEYMGKNRGSCCFLVDCPGQAFIPEDQLRFLMRILSACKYSLDDIALINTAGLPIRLEALKKQLHPKILFLWGVLPATIGIQELLQDYHVSIIDNISVIPVRDPELMNGTGQEGLELKQRLWTCLKKLFNL